MPGFISLSIPQSGQPNSTEDPKVATDLTTIQTAINGGLDDTNLFAPNNGVRRLLLQATCAIGGNQAAADYLLASAGPIVSGGSLAATGVPFWVPDSGLSAQPQDFQVANKVAYGRVRGCILTNSVAPGVNFTFGLYAITAVAGSGGINVTFGSATAGTTVAVTAPSTGLATYFESPQFALPAAGNPCFLGVSLSGLSAGNSYELVCAQLYGYNA